MYDWLIRVTQGGDVLEVMARETLGARGSSPVAAMSTEELRAAHSPLSRERMIATEIERVIGIKAPRTIVQGIAALAGEREARNIVAD